MVTDDNPNRSWALKYALETRANMFLTGKAGTGKTTLLHEIVKLTHKNYAIVAPTGVAAINAGGSTIHSFFQLPIASFTPEYTASGLPPEFVDRHQLTSTQRIKTSQRKVIAALDMLIVDEISMVRADLLDAVDATLRRIRKSNEPFGGIQVIAIGDLSQLSPVVKEHEWAYLKRYYASPYFFESNVWLEANAITIELEKVYRQKDPTFVNILNNIRADTTTNDDIDQLNARYVQSTNGIEAIMLTTHNHQADIINSQSLEALPGKVESYKAEIIGRFSESSYPVDEIIHLKKDAKVMFVKNDPTGQYYNGKIGKVIRLDEGLATIMCDDDPYPLVVSAVEWTNTGYELQEDTGKTTEVVYGSYRQLPLRLAWAVTVHKSQGLTFDQVILDVAKTFAAGQLYVALSRCRSLEGIYLTSQIQKQNVITDRAVKSYMVDQSAEEHSLSANFDIQKRLYQENQVIKAFHTAVIEGAIDDWSLYLQENPDPISDRHKTVIREVHLHLTKLNDVVAKFDAYFKTRFAKDTSELDNEFYHKVESGITYFTDDMYNHCAVKIDDCLEESVDFHANKRYISVIETAHFAVWAYITQLYELNFMSKSLYIKTPSHKKSIVNTNPKTVKKDRQEKKRAPVGETYNITESMIKEGLKMEEIASKRDMSIGTIESHIARLIGQGKVEASHFLPLTELEATKAIILQHPDLQFSDLITKLPKEFTYSHIKLTKAWMSFTNEQEE